MLRILRNRIVVRPDRSAFFRNNIGNVRIILSNNGGVTGPYCSDPAFLLNHFLFDVIRIKSKHAWQQILQIFYSRSNLSLVLRTVRMSCFFQSHANHFTVIIQEKHLALIFRIPQVFPAIDFILNIFRVICNSRNPGCIYNRVLIIRVKRRVLKRIGNIRKVRNITLVERCQQILFNHRRYHIVRRLNQIISTATGFNFSQKILIVREHIIIDLNIELLLKFRQDIGIEIISPTINVQRLFG
ncbi:hypothetical protein D3C73_940160 [compost metagenome]